MNATATIRPSASPVSEGPQRVPGYTPTILEVDAAAAYADYAVEIRYRNRPPVSRTDDVDGRPFRWAGEVRVLDDKQLITLTMYPESREADLQVLRGVVRDIRTGGRAGWPWQEHRGRTSGRTWFSLVPGYDAEQFGELGRYIVPCTTVGCVRQGSHDLMRSLDDGVFHDHADSIETVDYRLRLSKVGGEPWLLDVDNVGVLDAAAVGRLVNDLAWLRGTLGQLNGAQAEVPC